MAVTWTPGLDALYHQHARVGDLLSLAVFPNFRASKSLEEMVYYARVETINGKLLTECDTLTGMDAAKAWCEVQAVGVLADHIKLIEE